MAGLVAEPDDSYSDQILKDYKKAVIDYFSSHIVSLKSIPHESTSKLAEKAYEAGLTSEPVKNYDDLASQFTKGVELKNSLLEIQTHCKRFLEILKDIGGLAANAAESLRVQMSILAGLLPLLSRYRPSNEELEKECDDDLFNEISQHMDDDYIKVGRGLHLLREVLESISQTENGDDEKKVAILWAWKRINGSTATAINLIKAFLKMSDQNMAEAILKYLSRRTTLLPRKATSLPREATSLPQEAMFHLAPEKAKSHYPNWEYLTAEEKERVRDQLMDDNRIVRKAYVTFVTQLMQSFDKRGVEPMQIQLIIQSYGVQPFEKFDFSKNDSIIGMFSEVTKHCSWFNYELFRVIVDIVGNEYERECLKTYEDHHLIPYLKRSIFEIPFAPSHSQSQQTKLLVKISADLVITGNELKFIQRNLAKLLGFQSPLITHFEDYNEGCIELVFSLPTVVLNEHFSKSTLSRYLLWEPSRNSFKVDVDVITQLYVSETPEKVILLKFLPEKEDCLEPCIMVLRNEKMKCQDKEDDQHVNVLKDSHKQSLEHSLKQIKASDHEDLYKTGKELKNSQLQNVAKLLCF